MKPILFSLALLFNYQLIFAEIHPLEVKIEKKKTYKKEYNVNDNNTLHIDNEYGNINITTWNENRIYIEVIVTASAKEEKWVDSKLDEIKIYMSQTGNSVSARTEISDDNWNWGFSNKKIQFKIDYFIKMPIKNNVILNNEYGRISLSELEGESKISCDYGGITIGELKNSNNHLDLEYCNNSTIEYAKNINIEAAYSSLQLTKIDNSTLSAAYCKTIIESVGALTYEVDYGSLKIGNANIVKGNNDYLNLTIDQINKRLDISCDYGNLKINSISKNFESIDIDSDYLSIKLGLDSQTYFKFDLSNDYAQISFDGFTPTYTYKAIESSEKTYRGYVGSQNAGTISIRSSYGGISIYSLK
jgi:hypothetical protein